MLACNGTASSGADGASGGADTSGGAGTSSGAGAFGAASNDASACEGAACECPPPREGNCSSREPSWSRNLATGTCCVYDGACLIPMEWSRFDSLEECESSCRCSDVTPVDLSQAETIGGAAFGLERTSIECWCSDRDCEPSFAEAAAIACTADRAASLSQIVGCGMIALDANGGFVGGTRVFDAGSGALIGHRSFSDVPILPCNVYNVLAGVDFDCGEAVECPLCDGTVPRLDGCD